MSSAIFSEKVFNDLKHEPYYSMEYATQVSKFVAQGACRDFRHAYENWRNPKLPAARPSFKKKNRVGGGSFLAASGVARIRYDAYRRIRLPYLGSVKLKRELPHGLPYIVQPGGPGQGPPVHGGYVRFHHSAVFRYVLPLSSFPAVISGPVRSPWFQFRCGIRDVDARE